MTNQPGLRMVIQKLKQQLESLLNVFNVSLYGNPARKPQPAAQTPLSADADQPPLTIGNELLITDEIVIAYRNLYNARGRVVIIDQIPGRENHGVKASAFGIQVNVNMQEAQDMREAYLAWQQD